MSDTSKFENNKVVISGIITSDFKYDHNIYRDTLYSTTIDSRRTSGTIDSIPVIVSDRNFDVSKSLAGQYVKITGYFRSYNKYAANDKKVKLLLYVFATEIEIFNEMPQEPHDINKIYLDGYICKDINFRHTPLNREIADILLGVNRPNGKADYIPCIIWGRNAEYATSLSIGTRVEVEGRVQSRSYMKQLSETEAEERTAYEISIKSIGVLEEQLARTV